jgi:hypothetical protein
MVNKTFKRNNDQISMRVDFNWTSRSDSTSERFWPMMLNSVWDLEHVQRTPVTGVVMVDRLPCAKW